MERYFRINIQPKVNTKFEFIFYTGYMNWSK